MMKKKHLFVTSLIAHTNKYKQTTLLEITDRWRHFSMNGLYAKSRNFRD